MAEDERPEPTWVRWLGGERSMAWWLLGTWAAVTVPVYIWLSPL